MYSINNWDIGLLKLQLFNASVSVSITVLFGCLFIDPYHSLKCYTKYELVQAETVTASELKKTNRFMSFLKRYIQICLKQTRRNSVATLTNLFLKHLVLLYTSEKDKPGLDGLCKPNTHDTNMMFIRANFGSSCVF